MTKQGLILENLMLRTMLSNIFLIPYILGHEIPSLDSWEDRYFNELMEIEDFPHEILDFIACEEMEWIKALHESPKLTTIREKYIGINDQLENLPRGERRTKLCYELFRIRDLDFSGIEFSEIDNDQTSDNSND